MKNILSLVFVFLLLTPVYAQDFCRRSQKEILDILNSSTARIAFKNAGGLFNGGVCWWHGRLQRSSAYLVRFDPTRAKPSSAQVQQILMDLRSMKKVVTIPGYSNFRDFTKENQTATQRMLDGWQRFDGVINSEWRRGISGRTSLPASELEKQMSVVFEAYKTSPVPIWIMAQMKGITSHSFLIIDMAQQSDGFDLKVIDSNAPDKNRFVAYRYGQTFLTLVGGKTPFIPYVGFQNDFRLIAAAIKDNCRQKAFHLDGFDQVQDGQIELPR